MVNDLRKKSNKELGDLIIKLKNQLLEYRFKAAVGQLEKTHKIKIVKKTIAVSFSILNERNVNLSISSHDYSLIEVKEGKTTTTSIGKGLLDTTDLLNSSNVEKIENKSKDEESKNKSKKTISNNNEFKKENKKEKTIKTGSETSSKPAPKKIVTKSNNNQTKKTNIVKKAQRGV